MARVLKIEELAAVARVRAAALEAAVAGAERSAGRMASPALRELFLEAGRAAEALRGLEVHEARR